MVKDKAIMDVICPNSRNMAQASAPVISIVQPNLGWSLGNKDYNY